MSRSASLYPSESAAAPAHERRVSLATLLFFHIGKTGGTSLTRFFRSLTTHAHIQPQPHDFSCLQTPADADEFDFISGHYHLRCWLPCIPPYWQTMLVLRSPVRHVLSSYWHIRSQPEPGQKQDLRDLIASARRHDLGSLLEARPGPCFEEHFDNPQTRFILGKPTGPLDDRDLTDALALLHSLTYLGTTERLHTFAAHVASTLPWASEWPQRTLPHLMVNPCNGLATEEIPRRLLRRLMAATEIDAELHEAAMKHQSGRPPVRHPFVAVLQASARSIPVADLLRVLPMTARGVRPGHELIIDEDRILLHPASPGSCSAEIEVDGVPLDDHDEITGSLIVAHPDAGPVCFDIELWQAKDAIVAASFRVAAATPCQVQLRFRRCSGPARMILRTRMTDDHANAFAWATFVGLAIGGAASAGGQAAADRRAGA